MLRKSTVAKIQPTSNVSLSKNYTNYGLISPEILTTSNEKGKIDIELSKIQTLTELQLVLKLTGEVQHRLNIKKREKKNVTEDDYVFEFKSIYELLEQLGLPTNTSYYYEEMEVACTRLSCYLPQFHFKETWHEANKEVNDSFSCAIFDSFHFVEKKEQLKEKEHRIKIRLGVGWIKSNEEYFTLLKYEALKLFKSTTMLRLFLFLKTWEKVVVSKTGLSRNLSDMCKIIGIKTKNNEGKHRNFSLLKRQITSLNNLLENNHVFLEKQRIAFEIARKKDDNSLILIKASERNSKPKTEK